MLENVHSALKGVHLLDAWGHGLALKPDLDGIKRILNNLARHSCKLDGGRGMVGEEGREKRRGRERGE